MGDSLGDRMKLHYEDRVRYYLPRRTYTIMRIDGKAFHSWTRGLSRPFDPAFHQVMDLTTKEVCKCIQGSVFAYTQSDEASFLLIDFDPTGEKLSTNGWFNGNMQKHCSVGASIFTGIFNKIAAEHLEDRETAFFDCRVFTIHDAIEVYNYYVWRQNDATRNSIQSAARAIYSENQCFGKNCSELQEMIFQRGINWNDYPVRSKRGGFIYYNEEVITDSAINKKTGEAITFDRPKGWSVHSEVPRFTSDTGKSWLYALIPKLPLLSCEEE